ncbi:MAG TPA: Na(+)/H(+) antiporter subunit D [Desulfotomaculum sp.]|nr:Na(+)/H(+) antiporter subunit D [Desulfotomaculum sp.]
MSFSVPPAALFIAGAFLVVFLRGMPRSFLLLVLPVLSLLNLLSISDGIHWIIHFMDYKLIFGRVDRLSLAFGYIFTMISFIANLYALRVDNNPEHTAALLYTGSSLGVVFAGDFLTLLIFWEIMSIGAAYFIWARRTTASYAAGMRYLLVHIFGGFCLLCGILMHVHNTGSIEFGYLGLGGLASLLIFIGFGINCAWPGLHTWLTDAYPEATITGTVFLSAFTTKCAVYALARSFPGTEILIWIGAIMTLFPIFFAVIENDLRRVLSYSLINQVGFMVVGIGIGTHLALNGATAHAIADIIFKALLFMAMGAVLHQTGKINATEVGGLHRTMPITCTFCMVGAASISAFPLFSAFATKSLIIEAVAAGHMPIIWFILIFASAGVFHHAGIKIPFFTFFARDSGLRPKEPPLNMMAAMGIAAFLCVFIGVCPGFLYSILPYPVDYQPYTPCHIVAQLQLLFFSALAFTLLILAGIYPPEMRAINLDADWFLRKGANVLVWFITKPVSAVVAKINDAVTDALPKFLLWFGKNPPAALKIGADIIVYNFTDRAEDRQRLEKEKIIYPRDLLYPWSIGAAVSSVLIFLLIYLLVYFLYYKTGAA